MRRKSELHEAASQGDRDRVSALLSAGTDIEERDRYGCTPLMSAVSRDQVDCARLLVERGADLYAVDREGKSALHYAAMHGGPEAVRLLIRLGADVNTPDTFGGYAPLHLAAAHSRRHEMIETCDILLAAGADVNARTKWGGTPLWKAALSNRGDLLDFLLKCGAELEARDTQGRTVLIFETKLSIFGSKMVNKLLTHGADVNAQDAEGHTALMYAALSASQSLLTTLLDAGADISLQDTQGRTALIYAAGEAPKASEIGMLGREAGTLSEGGNAPNWDPVKKAARVAKAYQGRAEAVRLLLARGADAAQRDESGQTALDLARLNAQAVGEDNAAVIRVLAEAAP